MVLDKCHTGALSSAGEGEEKEIFIGGHGRALNFVEFGVGAEIRCLGRDERSGVGGETQERT